MKLGLNTKSFTENDSTSGFIIYGKDDVPNFIDCGNKLAFIILTKNSFVKKKDEFLTITNEIYIEKIINIEDWEMWNDSNFCLEASKREWRALKFIKNQTVDMVYYALIQDGQEILEENLCSSKELYSLVLALVLKKQ